MTREGLYYVRLGQGPVIEWLLQPDQPSVRYHTLVDLLDRPLSANEVREAYSQIARRGWASDILQKQKSGGYWESRKDLYGPKYVATIWRFLVLVDLGLTAKNPRLRKTSQLLLEEFSRPDGGFDDVGPTGHFCITGNLARAFVKCGYADDPRVRAAFNWLVKEQKPDGGWHCFGGRSGTLDCWEALSAYATLPRTKWTRSIGRSAERGAEFYLQRELFREGRKPYRPWLRFHYPIHYYYDLLVGLEILTQLGYGDDSRMRPALDILKEKRRSDGSWALDPVHPDMGPGAGYRLGNRVRRFALEKARKPSRWITLKALRVLKLVQEAK